MPEYTVEICLYNGETGKDFSPADLNEAKICFCQIDSDGEDVLVQEEIFKAHPGKYILPQRGRWFVTPPPDLNVGCDRLTPQFRGRIAFDVAAHCECTLRIPYRAEPSALLVQVWERPQVPEHRCDNQPAGFREEEEDGPIEKPLAGATVEAWLVRSGGQAPPEDLKIAQCDACGIARFRDLVKNETYRINVVRPANRQYLVPVRPQYYRFCGTPADPLVFTLTGMASRTWVVIHDEYGEPYRGEVDLCHVSGPGERGCWTKEDTDDNGVLLLTNRVGRYSATAGALSLPDFAVREGLHVLQLAGLPMRTSTVRIHLKTKAGRPLRHERAELVEVAGDKVLRVLEVVHSNDDGSCHFALGSGDLAGVAVRVRKQLIPVGEAAAQAQLQESVAAPGVLPLETLGIRR